jgi:hypothetical protein
MSVFKKVFPSGIYILLARAHEGYEIETEKDR